MQKTLRDAISFDGHGLHQGLPARVTLRPAVADTGVVFRRVDAAGRGVAIPALWHNVEVSPLNTRLVSGDVSVSTIEHLMAALSGCGVSNVVIDIDGPEVPIMDGSAAAFVRGIVATGIVTQRAPLYAIEILSPVRVDVPTVSHDAAWASLRPATSLQIDFDISFSDAAIGDQRKALNMANGSFVRELCDSRTFCRASDVTNMQSRGLALGGSLDNAIVVDGDRVMNPGGLRHADEAVRHKMLDALGDLYTAGAPILGRYTGHKAGHGITNHLLRALFARPDAYRLVRCNDRIAARLPGVGVSVADLAAVA